MKDWYQLFVFVSDTKSHTLNVCLLRQHSDQMCINTAASLFPHALICICAFAEPKQGYHCNRTEVETTEESLSTNIIQRHMKTSLSAKNWLLPVSLPAFLEILFINLTI